MEGYDGNRVILKHPLENSIIERTLNIPSGILDSFWNEKPRWWWSKKKRAVYQNKKAVFDTAQSRRGFLSECLCLDCREQQKIDLKKDEKKCWSCSSLNIKSFRELLNSVCPKCNQGLIIEMDTGIMA